ncbi:hypothetical protein CLV99_0461 [Sphingobacterium yanglingense]|uniref:Uncharacterized protein n=1 Tax=Sphingobacterium yanglingense TaxID=1437280 RepID=A0A4R6WKL9_9SPHI|nr:hypothetical protein CLV99_0461 [Sphingobacterium yanglingense]
MAGPGLAAGTFTQGKAILWLTVYHHRLAISLSRITTVRSSYRCAGFRYPHRRDIWTADRLASRVHQYLAARTLVASV